MPQIYVSEESFSRIAEYAAVYGMTNDKAINKAVDHWWDDVGSFSVSEARRRGIAQKRRPRRKPVLEMPGVTVIVPSRKVVNQ